MYVQPKDSRQRYTKECLSRVFLKILETKSLADITVSEISTAAGISRKTFYKYYSNPFAFLKALEEDLFVGFKQELATLPPNVFDITPSLIEFAEKHRVLVRAALENWDSHGFIDQALEYLYRTYRKDWEAANPDMSKRDVGFLFQYVVSGLVGVLRFWLVDNPKMPASEVISRADYLLRLSTPR
ncbi:MAG: TetR/AcrR family transcriptional regulator [Coriobacteriia bacterium]|jgi:AcrR family transcriptional regulator|nr:TetR/AcrR family transcriptional regulator [Coriobacteriia bacterium]MDR2715071.1 TetR/AcrR family transcriptional regulator [Coriobacteriales bacterium]